MTFLVRWTGSRICSIDLSHCWWPVNPVLIWIALVIQVSCLRIRDVSRWLTEKNTILYVEEEEIPKTTQPCFLVWLLPRKTVLSRWVWIRPGKWKPLREWGLGFGNVRLIGRSLEAVYELLFSACKTAIGTTSLRHTALQGASVTWVRVCSSQICHKAAWSDTRLHSITI